MQEAKEVSAFGCCAYWKKCKLGTETCVYSETNPAKRNSCGAYKRAQGIGEFNFPRVEVVQSSLEQIETSDFDANEDGQLTLF